MSKAHFSELTFIRAFACITIVTLHTVERALEHPEYKGTLGQYAQWGWESAYMLMFYGTPLFIFLSEVLIAYFYKNGLPASFFPKRLKYIFLPFVFMAFYYAATKADSWLDFTERFFMHAVIGDYHGYFVLIIFQFYLLHWLGHRWLAKQAPGPVIFTSLLITVAYLSVFNFIPAPSFPFSDYVWERYYWVPFPGWLFYFVTGYYVGRSYPACRQWLKAHRASLYWLPLLTSVIVLALYWNEWLTILSSKRVDLVLHTSAVLGAVLAFAIRFPVNHTWVQTVSRYSFGIYLWHMYYLFALKNVLGVLSIELPFSIYVVTLVGGSTVLSMLTMRLLNRLPFGAALTGLLKPASVPKAKTSLEQKERLST
ncbi:acyltransferase family protein [Bacillaceae bacterium SIJ1]|uniref:acyltransferase family protein n=1 Tax=Litoribacterium kuwaitense TaxID=1398745 RepID=UPI0013EB78C0|nr:acyltransferase family protein [Litoribacterium kuwaitense]NGP45389.1 acyltransferase family protein [Litoribacterium kuwaitense]